LVRLREYQGKQLLKKVGIPIPKSGLATSVQEATEITQQINKPVMIKAQILTTGRYKAGGIKSAGTNQEIQSKVEEMLGKEIKGLKVEKVLIEEKLDVAKEFYMSVTINDSYKVRAPVILFSLEGGVDIEEIAEKNPEAISRMSIDYIKGFQT
jgi:succinyl-CoA synthetase beta subunit